MKLHGNLNTSKLNILLLSEFPWFYFPFYPWVALISHSSNWHINIPQGCHFFVFAVRSVANSICIWNVSKYGDICQPLERNIGQPLKVIGQISQNLRKKGSLKINSLVLGV